MPLWAVAVTASVFFGLAHLYQGPRNAGRTLIAGALLWATYGRALRQAFTEPAPIAAPVP